MAKHLFFTPSTLQWNHLLRLSITAVRETALNTLTLHLNSCASGCPVSHHLAGKGPARPPIRPSRQTILLTSVMFVPPICVHLAFDSEGD